MNFKLTLRPVYTYRRWISSKCQFGTIHVFVPVAMHIFRPLWSSSDGVQPSPNVLTLYHAILQLVGQQLWPIHYSMYPDFKHRSSQRCHIQHGAISAASLLLFTAVLHVLPDSPILVSSFLNDCAGNTLQPTSTGNNYAHPSLSLRSAMRSKCLGVFLSILFPWHVSSIVTSVFD